MQTFTHTLRRIGMAVMTSALLLAGMPAAAQCNPSTDPTCGETPAAGPEAGISPDGGTYEADPAAPSQTVPVSIVFTDPDGINPGTLQIRLQNGSTAVPVTLATTVGTDQLSLRARGDLVLENAGDNILVAQLADKLGNVSSVQATFRLTLSNPNAPVVSTESHHNEFRDTRQGAFMLPYNVASYASGGVQREVSLVYNSEHSRPGVAAHIDARPDVRSGQNVIAMSLRMQYWTADGSPGTQLGREAYYQKGWSPFQRMAWRVDTNSQPGGYKYAAVVRSHFADGAQVDTRHFVRVLLLNERNSHYGVGWSVAGVQRLYNYLTPDGWVLSEGNGIARFFANGPCSSTECSYVTPAGDFTRFVKRIGSNTYLRTYPDGSTVTFSALGLMTHSSDRFGNTTTYEWQQTQDAVREWVLSRIVDPLGHAVTFNYGPDWYLTSITSPGRTTAFAHNAARDLTTISGARTLKLAYTSEHLLSSYTEAYGTGAEQTWNVAYDVFRKVVEVKAPAVTAGGVLVRPVTTYRSVELLAIPKAGQGTSLMNPVPAIDSAAAWYVITDAGGHSRSMTLNRYGLSTKVVDLGATSDLQWTSDGLPASSSSPTQHLTNVWTESGQLLQQRSGDAVVYEASYDEYGRLMTERFGDARAWYSYGSRGELVRSWYAARTDSERTETTYEYNSRYQLTRLIGPTGKRTEWSYEGNVWRNADFQRVTLDDGTIVMTTFTYDDRGRPATVTNGLNQVTTTTYDDLDRPVRVTDALGRHTRFEYVGAHLAKVTDAAGKVFEYTHNALGWLESERLPGDPNSRTYRYDVDGQVVSKTDRRGNTVTMTYDNAHRPYDATADGATTTFRYPDAHNTTVSNAESTVTMRTVPSVGELDYVSTTLGARRYEVKTVFDDQGVWQVLGRDLRTYVNDTLQSTDPIRYMNSFSPTEANIGQTASVQDLSGRQSTAFFDTAGRPVRIGFANGITQSNSFAGDGRLVATHFSAATADQAYGATYGHDRLGRVTMRTSSAGNRAWAYSYDETGQLSTFAVDNMIPVDCVANCTPGTGPRIHDQYTYDTTANRTDGGAVLTPGTNRYSSFKGFKLSYDAEGNVTRKYKLGFDQLFTWNSLGQLSSVTTNGVTVSYGYDGLGRRVRRTTGGASQYFLYDGQDLLLETDATGATVRVYSHWPGVDRPHSVRTTSGGRSAMYYYTMEAPGHVTGLMDAAGSVVESYRYTPFGEVETETNVTGQPLRFMARELDPGTKLYYVRNRWYDPSLARFASEDPLGIGGGINTYAYAANDPVSMRDPSGLTPSGAGPCDQNPPPPQCVLMLPRLEVEVNWWETGFFAALAAERERQSAIRPDPVGMGFRMSDTSPAGRRAEVQWLAGMRVTQNLVEQCQQTAMRSNRRLVRGAAAALTAGHTLGSGYNNLNRPEVTADEATRTKMLNRQINSNGWSHFYVGAGGFLIGTGIGTGINQIACSVDEYWLARRGP